VDAVVGLLAVDLGGEAGDLRVVRLLQALEANRIGFLVEIVARDRPLPVHQPQLDDRRAEVFLGRPVERQLVGRGAELPGG